MHQQKESFRNIFETAKDWADGVFQLIDWMKNAQENFQDSVATIGRWFGGNYSEERKQRRRFKTKSSGTTSLG